MSRRQSRRARTFWACLAGAVLAATPTSAFADDGPVLTVRGRAALDVEPLRPTEDGVAVAGAVTDRVTGEPIAGADVTITLGEDTAVARAGPGGRFEIEMPADDAARDLRVEFAGSDHYPAAAVSRERLHPRELPLSLELHVPDSVDLAADELPLAIAALSEGRPASVSVGIRAGPTLDALEPIADVSLDRGRADVAIEAGALGGPGVASIEAVAAGAGYTPTRTRAEIEVTSATRTELELSSSRVDIGGELVARGRVVDVRGEAVNEAVVALEAGGREIAAALTGEDGAFAAAIPAARLGEGEIDIAARFEPVASWLEGSTSPSLPVAIGVPPPIPLAYTLLGFGAAVGLAVAYAASRSLAGRRLGRRDRALRPPRSKPGPEAAAGIASPPTPRRRRLLRASDSRFSGIATDAITGDPIPSARISIRGTDADDERSLAADAGGRFAIDLPRGAWCAEISAPGYVREGVEFKSPHRGEHRGVAVALLPVRERIFALYRDVAEPLLPRVGLWGIWTPRQIVDHVRRERPASALAALTDRVEEAYFSARIPEEGELAEVWALVEAARAEPRAFGDRPSAAPGVSKRPRFPV